MARIPNADLPIVDPKTGRINLEWYAALQRVAAGTLPYGVFSGSGLPTLRASKGSIYIRDDATTTNERAYINIDGGTTWTAIITEA